MSRPSPSPTSTDRPRRMFSRFYARISERMEAEGMTTLRQELLADLAGAVVEVGAGNGLNFSHYPPAVAQVVRSSPSPTCAPWPPGRPRWRRCR